MSWGRAVADVLGHEPHYLCVEEGGRIAGVLPLALRRSRLFGTNLVSVPAANVGGPLADDDTSAQRLVEGATALARELNVKPEEVAEMETRLSGGEIRRAALARTLAPAPDILLLDEPTNHLDAESVAWLERHLARNGVA